MSLTILLNILDWLTLISLKSIPNRSQLSSFIFMPAKNSSTVSRLRNPVLGSKVLTRGKQISSILLPQRLRTKAYQVRNYINMYIIFFSSLKRNFKNFLVMGERILLYIWLKLGYIVRNRTTTVDPNLW